MARLIVSIVIVSLSILFTTSAVAEPIDGDQQEAIEAAQELGAIVTVGPAPDYSLTIDYCGVRGPDDPFFDLLSRLINLRELRIDPRHSGNGRGRPEINGDCLERLDACPQLEALSYSCSSLLPVELEALNNLPDLKSLSLSIDNKMEISDLSTLSKLESLQHLESLRLQCSRGFSKLSDPEADCGWLVALPAIRDLRLSSIELTDADIAILAGKPDLRTLELYTRGFSDEGIKSIGTLQQLEWLYLPAENATDAGIAQLDGLHKLKKLTLSCGDRSRVTLAALSVLQNFQQLEELGLYGSCFAKSSEHLAGLKSLKSLSFGNCDLSGDDLSGLRSLSSLEKLRLSEKSLTDAAMSSVGELSNLKQLHIRGESVSDVGMLSLKKLTKLKNLTIWGTKVTASGMEFLRGCPELETLDIEHAQIGGGGLKPLAECRHLTSLQLWECGVTDADLAALRGLDKLEHLTLFKEGQVTDAGFAHLADSTGLKSIHLQKCAVTEAGFAHLGKCQKLEFFEIETPLITERGMASLSRLAALRSIDMTGELQCDQKCVDSLKKMPNLKRLKVNIAKQSPVWAHELAKVFPNLEISSRGQVWNSKSSDSSCGGIAYRY